MAKRDVDLIIRARSEADRAIDSISSALRNLTSAQDKVSASGERTGSTLDRIAAAFGTLDSAIGKIDQSVAASERALAGQQQSLAANEARYASLAAQVRNAEQAIINTRLAMREDGSQRLAANLGAAQQAYRQLVAEAARLESTIASQKTSVAAAEAEYGGLRNAATAAQVALGAMGDSGEREALRVKAAAEQATRALLDQAEAARKEVAARNAQAAINERLGVRDFEPGAARRSAEVFEQDFKRQAASAEELARAQREAAQSSQQLDQAAARLRARLNPIAVEQDRLNKELAEARTLYQSGRISIREYVAEQQRLAASLKNVENAQSRVNRNGSAEFKGFLGLRPYELQNLSYQINDVITQIASGTPVTQTFAQQGGQILQLFPRVLTGFLKYARGLTLVGLAIAPVVIGMSRLASTAKLQRDFEGALLASADAGLYNAKALTDTTRAIDDYGVSLEDATAMVKTFVQEGVNPELIESFGIAAKNASDVLGIELADAAKESAKAFTSGYDAIAEFDNKLNFLTKSEREQIREMFESGRASEARELAFQRFYDRVEDGSRKAESSFDRMTRSMSNAWSGLVAYLGDLSVFDNIASRLDSAAVGATYLINRLRGVDREAAALDALGKKRAGDGKTPKGDPLAEENARAAKRRQDRLAEIADERKLLNAKSSSQKIAAAGERAYQSELRKSGDVALANAEKELAMARARESGRKKGGGGGKSDADRQADFNLALDKANRAREREAANLTATNVLRGEALLQEKRRQEIADAIAKAEEQTQKAGKKSLALSEQQRAEIARTVGLQFDAANAKALENAKQEAFELRLNDLVEQRRRLIEASEFTSPGSDSFNALQGRIRGVNVEIGAATEEMIAFWTAVQADPKRMALLDVTAQQVQNIVAQLRTSRSSIQRDTLKVAQQEAERGLAQLNSQRDLLQEQIEFAQRSGQSGRAGLLGQQLVEVNERLVEGAQKAIEFWRAVQGDPEQLNLMGLTALEVDNIVLGLENTIASARRLKTQFLETGEALNRSLAAGGTNALDEFAQSIVNGENALGSLARAFGRFAADFLLQIARMIAQQALFNALAGSSGGGYGGVGGALAGAIGGIFHGGGVIGGVGARRRNVSAALFSQAARYHGGGIAGLRPDEVPIIAQRGEEILTRGDPRHRNNGGGGGGRPLSQILAIGDEQIAAALAGSAGRDVVMTHLRTDRATVRQMLGID